MKEYIKYFDEAINAHGYQITDLPWSAAARNTKQGIQCRNTGKHVVTVNDVMYIIGGETLLFLNDGSMIILTGETITSAMTSDYKSTLVGVEVGSGVTSIGSLAFFGCTGLNSVTIPSSVTIIGDAAFAGCSSLTSITIGSAVTSIGNNAFEHCISLPVENYLRYADWYLVEAVDKTKSTYTIKSGTKWIGHGAFSSCSGLTSITIPDSVTSIGNSAFYLCSGLTSITIPSGVTSIGAYAFYNCSGLTSVTIGSGVTNISNVAFSNCSWLTEMTCEATTPPTIDSITFNNVPKGIPVYVPADSISAYQSAQYWSEFTNYQSISTE